MPNRNVSRITVLYGPDGAGKTTLVDEDVENNPHLVSLHGTKLEEWPAIFSRYFALDLADPCQPEDIAARVSYATDALTILSATDTDTPVIVDGLNTLKTAASRQVKKFHNAEDPTPGFTAQGALRELETLQTVPLLALASVHCRLITPEVDPLSSAEILQQRIIERGNPSSWDPKTVPESYYQVRAYNALNVALRYIRLGGIVTQS